MINDVNIQGESPMNVNGGDGDYFEVEEFNSKIFHEYDPYYTPLMKWTKDHPNTQVISNRSIGVLNRTQQMEWQDLLNTNQEFCMFHSFIYKIESKTVKMALDHTDWVHAIQHELNEFENNKVQHLIPTPPNASVIGLKWVFRKKLEKKIMWHETRKGLL